MQYCDCQTLVQKGNCNCWLKRETERRGVGEALKAKYAGPVDTIESLQKEIRELKDKLQFATLKRERDRLRRELIQMDPVDEPACGEALIPSRLSAIGEKA